MAPKKVLVTGVFGLIPGAVYLALKAREQLGIDAEAGQIGGLGLNKRAQWLSERRVAGLA